MKNDLLKMKSRFPLDFENVIFVTLEKERERESYIYLN